VLISPTNDADAHSHTVDGLALSSYYELDVRALNALDCSPPFRPPFIFFTYPGTALSRSTCIFTTTYVSVSALVARRTRVLLWHECTHADVCATYVKVKVKVKVKG